MKPDILKHHIIARPLQRARARLHLITAVLLPVTKAVLLRARRRAAVREAAVIRAAEATPQAAAIPRTAAGAAVTTAAVTDKLTYHEKDFVINPHIPGDVPFGAGAVDV